MHIKKVHFFFENGSFTKIKDEEEKKILNWYSVFVSLKKKEDM